ncbi:MAG: hypothetical protein JW839_16860 [Candidatus Lokiarchaeota archaeon]|nr:hypothetical protein [Candidatus Lokiarchaeota archaeon]
MAATIPGIDIEAITPRRMCIKRRKSHSLKVKLLVIDMNNETIRVQGEKDSEARDYHARDLLSVHVKYPRPGSRVLAIAFMSGMEVELFEAGQKEIPILEAFRDELLGYFGEFVNIKDSGVAQV